MKFLSSATQADWPEQGPAKLVSSSCCFEQELLQPGERAVESWQKPFAARLKEVRAEGIEDRLAVPLLLVIENTALLRRALDKIAEDIKLQESKVRQSTVFGLVELEGAFECLLSLAVEVAGAIAAGGRGDEDLARLQAALLCSHQALAAASDFLQTALSREEPELLFGSSGPILLAQLMEFNRRQLVQAKLLGSADQELAVFLGL